MADIDRIKAHTGCDGVMIGRAAIGNPWIFQRKDREQVTLQDTLNLMRRHLQAMLDYYGERGLILFRKHATRYIHAVPGAGRCATRSSLPRQSKSFLICWTSAKCAPGRVALLR